MDTSGVSASMPDAPRTPVRRYTSPGQARCLACRTARRERILGAIASHGGRVGPALRECGETWEQLCGMMHDPATRERYKTLTTPARERRAARHRGRNAAIYAATAGQGMPPVLRRRIYAETVAALEHRPVRYCEEDQPPVAVSQPATTTESNKPAETPMITPGTAHCESAATANRSDP